LNKESSTRNTMAAFFQQDRDSWETRSTEQEITSVKGTCLPSSPSTCLGTRLSSSDSSGPGPAHSPRVPRTAVSCLQVSIEAKMGAHTV
jgi:hypothetical protein